MSRQPARALLALLFAFAVAGAVACSASAPNITIQSPANGSAFTAGQDVTIASVAKDDGGIVSVDLLVDGVTAWNKRPLPNEANTLFAAPFTWKATEGTHTLGVKAYNAAGAASSLISITVSVSATSVLRGQLAVFVRDGHMHIFAVNPDGSGQTQLTNGPGDDNRPSISPDETRIAFDSNRDGNWEIYVMNRDGKQQTRLTNNKADDARAEWSPDGKRIAFLSDRDGQLELYVMNADGSDQTRLTTAGAALDRLAWSPDGKRLAFTSNRDGNTEIYVVNADGSGEVRLTDTPKIESSPAWSPDGKKIAFESRRDGNSDVYIMNVDGSEQTRLTNLPGVKGGIEFGPDGAIWFQSVEGGTGETYRMKVDGSGLALIGKRSTGAPQTTPTPVAR